MFLVPGGFHEADVRNDGVDDAVVCAAGCDCVVFVAFGTGKGLLWYGICARCKKQAPVVRGAFSGALGAKNRLLWYGSDIRYRKPLLWYGADIRCAEQPSVVRDAFSGAPGTQQPPPAPSGALKIGLLLVQKADSGVWRQELLCGPEDS